MRCARRPPVCSGAISCTNDTMHAMPSQKNLNVFGILRPWSWHGPCYVRPTLVVVAAGGAGRSPPGSGKDPATYNPVVRQAGYTQIRQDLMVKSRPLLGVARSHGS